MGVRTAPLGVLLLARVRQRARKRKMSPANRCNSMVIPFAAVAMNQLFWWAEMSTTLRGLVVKHQAA